MAPLRFIMEEHHCFPISISSLICAYSAELFTNDVSVQHKNKEVLCIHRYYFLQTSSLAKETQFQ